MVNEPSGSPGSSGGSDTGSVVTEEVKQQAQQAVQQTQQAVGQVAQQAQQQAKSALSGQKTQAAQGLSDVADALRQTGQQLQQKNQGTAGQVIDRAADGVEGVAGYLQSHEIGDMVYEVESFARRNPAMFLGGAFALGVLAARFLKSSPPGSGAYGQSMPPAYGGTYSSAGYPRYESVQGVPDVSYRYAPGMMGSQSPSGAEGTAYEPIPQAWGTNTAGYSPESSGLGEGDGTSA